MCKVCRFDKNESILDAMRNFYNECNEDNCGIVKFFIQKFCKNFIF